MHGFTLLTTVCIGKVYNVVSLKCLSQIHQQLQPWPSGSNRGKLKTSPSAAAQPTNSANAPYFARLTKTSETAALNLWRTESDCEAGSSETERAHLALRVEICAIAGAPVGDVKSWCWHSRVGADDILSHCEGLVLTTFFRIACMNESSRRAKNKLQATTCATKTRQDQQNNCSHYRTWSAARGTAQEAE